MIHITGAPDTIRTYDLQFRKLLLYPAELRARDTKHFSMSRQAAQLMKGIGLNGGRFDDLAPNMREELTRTKIGESMVK